MHGVLHLPPCCLRLLLPLLCPTLAFKFAGLVQLRPQLPVSQSLPHHRPGTAPELPLCYAI